MLWYVGDVEPDMVIASFVLHRLVTYAWLLTTVLRVLLWLLHFFLRFYAIGTTTGSISALYDSIENLVPPQYRNSNSPMRKVLSHTAVMFRDAKVAASAVKCILSILHANSYHYRLSSLSSP